MAIQSKNLTLYMDIQSKNLTLRMDILLKNFNRNTDIISRNLTLYMDHHPPAAYYNRPLVTDEVYGFPI